MPVRLRIGNHVLDNNLSGMLWKFQKVKDIPVGPADKQEKSRIQRAASQFLWFVSTGRNILVVVFCGVLAAMLEAHDQHPFKLTGMHPFHVFTSVSFLFQNP